MVHTMAKAKKVLACTIASLLLLYVCIQQPATGARLFQLKDLPQHCITQAGEGLPYRVVEAGYENTRFKMAIHGDQPGVVVDQVSNAIARDGMWEEDVSRHLLQLSETNPRRNPEGNVNVLDIGANIGWFTLLFAARGFTLWSVEPFDANLRLLRLSICLNQNFAERIHLIPYGLHTKTTQCSLFQRRDKNIGDTSAVCSDDPTAMELMDKQVVKLAEVEMRSLDELFNSGTVPKPQGGIQTLKIDVEGFEPFAIGGAKQFMSGPDAPRFIQTEFSTKMIPRAAVAVEPRLRDTAATDYLKDLIELGYCITRPLPKFRLSHWRAWFHWFQWGSVIKTKEAAASYASVLPSADPVDLTLSKCIT